MRYQLMCFVSRGQVGRGLGLLESDQMDAVASIRNLDAGYDDCGRYKICFSRRNDTEARSLLSKLYLILVIQQMGLMLMAAYQQ